MTVSRRSFVGGVAAALGYLNVGSEVDLFAQAPRQGAAAGARRPPMDDYDAIAHLSSNENCWGPPESVLKAMNQSFKYCMRYGYPGGDVVGEVAKLHGVKQENILLTAGSGEVLDVVGTTFLLGGKKVLGVEPSYSSVYQHATTIKSTAIKLPLGKDYRQQIPALIKAANDNASELGFVYMCNPNNPTGVIVTKDEIKQLLDGIPKDMPVLIDEAYHHFVDDPKYATSMPYVLEGRPVIIARTFSKIAALAAMRIGYAVAPAEIIAEDAAVLVGQHQRGGAVRRGCRAEGHRGAGRDQEADDRAAQEDAGRARSARLRDDPVRDQLLHGQRSAAKSSRSSRSSARRRWRSAGRSRR